MLSFINISLKGIIRDRILHGIIVSACIFAFIPSLASLSMRQVTELSITLCLSLVSFILLLLSIFIGATSVWKDMDRRFTFSLISLPMERSTYILGKFFATALFLVVTTTILGIVSILVIHKAIALYPPVKAIEWANILLAMLFHCMKYILLSAFAFLLSSLSTSFFLPIFGTISIFMVGNASQEAYDFIHSANGSRLSPLVQKAATALYYMIPNFSSFDLNINAIYGLSLDRRTLILTSLYFIVYTSILILGAITIFSRREMK